ncbi:MAG: hypothetical protein JNK15_11580 [Planctomycetes bacterium]|nr:hypothetical protein [Planctomycetota bacterium]
MLRSLAALAFGTAAVFAQCTTAIVPLPGGTNGDVGVLRRLANGDILVAGDFTTLLGVPANRIARWNGSTITPLGGGVNARVRDVLELPNGDLVVGGDFTSAGGTAIAQVARWDGTAWSGFGPGPGGNVVCLAARPNGDLFAGTGNADRARRWDGTAWSGIGVAPFPYPFTLPVSAMHTLPNGDIVLSGYYLLVAGGTYYDMVRWDGTTLHGMPIAGSNPTPSGFASRFVTLRDGTVSAVGAWTGWMILQWLGGTWTPLPGAFAAFGGANDLCELPDGDLVMCGGFFYIGSNQAARGVVRRHNGAWVPFGSGIIGGATCLLPLPSGEVLVGGTMTVVDGQPAQGLAMLVPTCPGAATPTGSGCVGSGGPLTLTATSLPYVGSIQRSRATGLPANAFGVGILGYTALALPLANLLPQGLAGCSLLASPDQLTLLPATAGEVATTLAVPNVQSLVGAVLHQQVASVELGAGGSITAVAATNALALTMGSF